jgi:hypothetical protein
MHDVTNNAAAPVVDTAQSSELQHHDGVHIVIIVEESGDEQ